MKHQKEASKKSWGNAVNEILKLKTSKEGKKYVRAEIFRLRKNQADWRRMPYKEAKSLYLSNIGYMSGYYSTRTARKILRLVSTEHPVFG